MQTRERATGVRVLITGITGQDGYYLARLLLARGAEAVFGAAQEVDAPEARAAAEELPGLVLLPFELRSQSSIDEAVRRSRPDQIFHLAGISHVGTASRDPQATQEVNTGGTRRLLDAVHRLAPQARLIFAGSADCFDHGAAGPHGVTPATPRLCTNPYAVSKSAAMDLVARFREERGLHASVAVLFNHTSPRRPPEFVEMKIMRGAVAIARGEADSLRLGSMDSRRDWSWAEEIVEGLAAMASRETPGDFVLASGELHSTGDWVRAAFGRLGLDVDRHLVLDPGELHRGDRPYAPGDIRETIEALGWRPRTGLGEMVDKMLKSLRAASERAAT